LETPKFKLADIFYAVIIPLILVLLIFVLAVYVNPGGQYHVLGTTGTLGTIGVIFSEGFAQMIVLGVPLAVGLLWNKWAGGAAGFITGGVYYLANAGLYTGYYEYLGTAAYHDFFGDLSMLFWLVNAIIIGYMAGALNNGSSNFKRMLGAGLTAAILTALIQVYMNYYWALNFIGATAHQMDYSPRSMAHQLWAVAGTGIHNSSGAFIPLKYSASSVLYGFTLAFIPSIALGIVVPIISRVMMWYGIQPMRHQ
jgi:hypothetical protein